MRGKLYGYPENVRNLISVYEEKRDGQTIQDIHHQIDGNAKAFRQAVQKNPDNEVGVTYTFLKQADYEVEKHRKLHPKLSSDIRCGKGCAFCCEINVSCSPAEADLVLAAVIEDNIPLDWDKVLRAAERGEDYDVKTVPREERQCVFLDPATRMCRVYEYRPGICRTYFSLEVPEHCDVEGPNTRIARFFAALADLIVAGIWNAKNPRTVASLPKQLLAARDRRLKAGLIQK